MKGGANRLRIRPLSKYYNRPCSYVGVGCAYEELGLGDFDPDLPEGLKDDGYLSLDNANRFVRQFLKVRKKQYFKRSERITLEEFLENNKEKCCICVLGHFIYADNGDYWSFFDNSEDKVVCVWYLKEG